MDILIIGNGFDLANKLPTRYSDFLEVCKITRDSGYSWQSLRSRQCYDLTSNQRNIIFRFADSVGNNYFDEFMNTIQFNVFVDHFIRREKVIGGNWLNLEEEIESLIRSIIDEMNKANSERFIMSSINSLEEYAKNLNLYKSYTYRDLFLKIIEEHKKLVRALEIYMAGYVNKLSIENKVKQINPDNYDGIVSFNYTDTILQKYESKTDCCFIHGKAILEKGLVCNMVLGFDDHYKHASEIETELIPYEKFFQRLALKTPIDYMKWAERMKQEPNNVVEIYGHSLAPADGDILSMFLKTPNTKTKIYYLNEQDRFEKLRNLTRILGANETIELVGGLNPKIEFELIEK